MFSTCIHFAKHLNHIQLSRTNHRNVKDLGKIMIIGLNFLLHQNNKKTREEILRPRMAHNYLSKNIYQKTYIHFSIKSLNTPLALTLRFSTHTAQKAYQPPLPQPNTYSTAL